MVSLLIRAVKRLSACKNSTTYKDSCKIAFRTFLSQEYGKSEHINKLFEAPAGEPEVALQCLTIDRCYEHGLPITSLTMDRVVRSVHTKEHVIGMKYYLNKFRHSENGYYLHPSTVFVFSQKCLQHHKETLLDVLDHKAQFGVFPNCVIFNQLIDEYLVQKDLQGAMRALKEIFLLELLDSKTAQTLVLKTVAMFWEQKSLEASSVPEFDDAEAKRNVAGSLFVIGKHQNNPSLQIIGLSLLGTVEKEHGVGAVYQNPWGPLHWEPNNLQQAIKELEQSTQQVSKQTTDILLQCVAMDETLEERARQAVEHKLAQNLITEDNSLTVAGLAERMLQQLAQFQAEDDAQLERDVSHWLADREVYVEAEEELKAELRKERREFYVDLDLDRRAHEQAIATLGYWNMKRPETTPDEDKARPWHLQKDYIEGCMLDLDILDRVRAKRGTEKNPIILFE